MNTCEQAGLEKLGEQRHKVHSQIRPETIGTCSSCHETRPWRRNEKLCSVMTKNVFGEGDRMSRFAPGRDRTVWMTLPLICSTSHLNIAFFCNFVPWSLFWQFPLFHRDFKLESESSWSLRRPRGPWINLGQLKCMWEEELIYIKCVVDPNSHENYQCIAYFSDFTLS